MKWERCVVISHFPFSSWCNNIYYAKTLCLWVPNYMYVNEPKKITFIRCFWRGKIRLLIDGNQSLILFTPLRRKPNVYTAS